MVSEHWPTYFVLALYVIICIVVTIAAKIKNLKGEQKQKDTEVVTHFLASKNFGHTLLLFTTFASVFSGYTVVGVPDETGKNGFTGIRWMALVIVVGLSMLSIFPRLRRLSVVRNYVSPGDFILDRYQSASLSILVTISTTLPQFLYIGINLYSLGTVVDSLTNGELSYYIVVIIAFILILSFEITGGMRSVAYTDVIEGLIMLFIFIIIPCFLHIWYGGFIGMVNNSNNLQIVCNNSNNDKTSGCLNFDDNDIATEYFLRSPSRLTIINYVIFSLSVCAFSLNPHLVQRAMEAKQDSDVRFVIIWQFLFTFITMVPGVLMGISYISNWNELSLEYQSYGAYQAILSVFRDKNGFAAIISYIALLSAVGSIMSTADSALIGVSNAISCDIFKNWIYPNIKQKKIVWIGKFVSICTMCIALCLAVIFYEIHAEYGYIYTLQNGILWQALPSHIFGLYTNIKKNCVLLGIIIGLISDIILIIIVYGWKDPFSTYHESLETLDKAWSTYLGVLLNIIACLIGHFFIWKDTKDTTTINDNKLNIEEIRKIMKGINEPITKYYGLFVWLTLALVIISAAHWSGPIDPYFIEKFGKDETKHFMYNGYIRNVIVGIPDWVFASFMWYLASLICGICTTYFLWTVNLDQYHQTLPNTLQKGDDINI